MIRHVQTLDVFTAVPAGNPIDVECKYQHSDPHASTI